MIAVSGLRRQARLRSPLELDSGASLGLVDIAYESYGRRNADRFNVILVCHSPTGDQWDGP